MDTLENKERCIIRRKHLIKVIYYSTTIEKGKIHRYKFTVQLLVGFGSSMREIAKKAIEMSFGKMPNWLEKVHDDQPISIHLDNRTKKETQNAPYGICYDIEKNGNVRFLDGYEPLSHDWTYRKIVELKELGYISGDVDCIVVETPEGLGAPGEIDFSALLDSTLVFIGIIANVEGVLQFKDRIVNRISYNRMVKDFKRNGLYNLKQIRQLLETNDKWKLKKVMKALSVNHNVAIAILKKLGYASSRGEWSFDNASTKALELRKEWLIQEKNDEKRINEIIMESFGK